MSGLKFRIRLLPIDSYSLKLLWTLKNNIPEIQQTQFDGTSVTLGIGGSVNKQNFTLFE